MNVFTRLRRSPAAPPVAASEAAMVAATPERPVAAPLPAGAYRLWPVDEAGQFVGDVQHDRADPHRAEAVDIYFGIVQPDGLPPVEPPPAQVALQTDIGAALAAIRRVFLDVAPPRPDRFRLYYVRLFALGQLGLEGHALPGAARIALTALTAELIDDEAGRVKNAHLVVLGGWAALFALPFVVAYALLSAIVGSPEWTARFAQLGVGILPLRNFLLLWVGCFLGVWISYGVRTTRFTLADLTTTDPDRLRPGMRLAFAGTLTMVLGIACAVGLVEVRVGGYPVTAIATEPMLAFLVGALCGISELSLPASISARAADFVKRAG